MSASVGRFTENTLVSVINSSKMRSENSFDQAKQCDDIVNDVVKEFSLVDCDSSRFALCFS